jgi:hypothetical protein
MTTILDQAIAKARLSRDYEHTLDPHGSALTAPRGRGNNDPTLSGLLADVATVCAQLTFDRSAAGIRDYDDVNLDRLFADSHDIGRHSCEPEQYQAGDQLTREPMGEHKGLGDAARNAGKPSQCAALVAGHVIVLV